MGITKHLHPANIQRHENLTFGERAADVVAKHFGSWTFLIVQTALIILWIIVNIIAIALAWDPYPFILLNLLFSVQAAYAAPLILLSQNRASEHDRIEAEVDYKINQETFVLLTKLHEEHMKLAKMLKIRGSA